MGYDTKGFFTCFFVVWYRIRFYDNILFLCLTVLWKSRIMSLFKLRFPGSSCCSVFAIFALGVSLAM